MKRLLPLALLLAGCTNGVAAAKGGITPGGCTIIKQAPTGEYPTAQLTKLTGDQREVCDHIIEAWNADRYLTGRSARYRCACPAE